MNLTCLHSEKLICIEGDVVRPNLSLDHQTYPRLGDGDRAQCVAPRFESRALVV